MKNTLVLTESDAPDSLDPLNADKTQNIQMMRMLYSTPLMLNSDGQISSTVLSKYIYDKENKKIIFEVKKGLRFSDGTDLTPQDVLLSILRVAYFKPNFPTIKLIKGLKTWSESNVGLNTLPAGILLNDSTIEIQLTEASLNPLFRFCLEIFSIIPGRCINSETGELICEMPPFSGFYVISHKENEAKDRKEIEFKRNLLLDDSQIQLPETIRFKYEPFSTACNDNNLKNHIVLGNELDLKSSACYEKLNKDTIYWQPSVRFSVIRINPKIEYFKNSVHRLYFSEKVREAYDRLNNNLKSERSLFTALIPGFLDSNDLKVNYFDSKDYSLIFKNQKIRLFRNKDSSMSSIYEALISAANQLEMDISITENISSSVLVDKFIKGEIHAVAGSSGFWALDPVGDTSMWFTPNFHKTMTFTWDDKQLMDMISSAEVEDNPEELKLKMQKLNIHIYKSSIVSPITHQRRFHIMHKNKEHALISITSPNPWDYFK